MASTRIPLGRLLVDAGLVTQSVLDSVLQDQATDGRRLGEILVARGHVTDVQLTQILSHQLSLPWVSLATVVPEPSLLAMLPQALVEHHHIVPIYVRRDRTRSVLYVASDDPTRESALRECAEVAGMDVRAMVAATEDIRRTIAAWYGGEPSERPSTAPPEAPAGAMRVAASIAPPAAPERKAVAKPVAIPAQRVPKIEELELPDEDVVPHISSAPVGPTRPCVLVVGGRGTFTRKCQEAADTLDANVERSDLSSALLHAQQLNPFAIVVPEDVYAFDRLGMTKLALQTNALLVIWTDDLEPEFLEPLLDTALKRRG